jgi:hypothetical protein
VPSSGLFPPNPSSPLQGIIAYLTWKHGANVHTSGIVTITSSSIWGNSYESRVKNVADLTNDAAFYSLNGPGQWMCWDFGELRIRPTHYSLRGDVGLYSPKSWIVHSSIDGLNWMEISRQADTNDLDGFYRLATYPVSGSDTCRFVRLTQTGKNQRGSDFLALTAFEIFGELIEGRH